MTLFHGTDVEFQIGDLITPQPRRSSSGLPRHLVVAHATTTVEHARCFGPFVYEVEPVGDLSEPALMERYDDEPEMLEVTSKCGFLVIRSIQ